METEDKECEEYIPRNYQVKLIAISVERNSIIYLPTGSGKTFIAVCALKELAQNNLDKPYGEGGKVSVMLVNTVALVYQHTEYLRRLIPYNVGAYTGAMNVDFWDRKKWHDEYNKNQILVMTTAIFNNTLSANVIDLEKVNLLILDECHQAVDAHCMRQVMMKFQGCVEQPRVLGLTATLLNGNKKITQVENAVGNLETTLHAKVATLDELDEVIGYSTNPQEKIEVFKTPVTNEVITYAIEKCEKLCEMIKKLPSPETQKRDARTLDLQYLDNKGYYDSYKKLLLDAIVHFNMLGVSGSVIALKCYVIDLECDKRLASDSTTLMLIDVIITTFTELIEKFSKVMSVMSPEHRLLAFASNKLMRLISILMSYNDLSDEEMCGIIFVQRKNTAIFLNHFIRQWVELNDNLKHLKSDFIIGFNANPLAMTREAMYNTKMNKKVVEKFKAKEVNILVASNVIEEGIDVPRCTLVIKFDTPTNYREYIQSKGRARHASSLYYIMVESNDRKFHEKYLNFQQVEQQLHRYLLGQNEYRRGPKKQDIEEMYEEFAVYYTDGPGSANVTMLTAIPTLMMYCDALQSDNYTNYEPLWYLEKRNSDFKVTLVLPIVAAIITPITGEWRSSKKMAKRNAALKTIIMLHKMGALNDQLVCVRREAEKEDFLFSHWPEKFEKNIGATNKRRLKNKLIPKCISEGIHPHSQLYLHIIEMSPTAQPDTTELDIYALTELYKSDRCFGFITSKPIPRVCEFPIYVSAGRINVTLDINHPIRLNEREINDIRAFHHLVFADIVNIKHQFLCLTNESSKNVLMVPVMKRAKSVDFAVVRTFKSVKEIVEPSHEQKIKLEVDDDGYYRKIISPWYRLEEIQYLVLRVCDEMVPKTPFPNEEFGSYEHYFSIKYNLNIYNQVQPLLYVKALSSRLNCLKPRGISKKRKHDDGNDDIHIHLIPELCVKEDISAELWVQAKTLPTIMHRILQLFRCEEFRSTVARETNLGVINGDNWAPMEIDTYLLNYETDSENTCQKKESNIPYTEQPMEIVQLTNTTSLNKEFRNKINDSQYPWLPETEPKDIRRNLDVTALDIDYYMSFIHQESPKEVQRKAPQRLAIKYNPGYAYKSIDLLNPIVSPKGPELKDVYQAFCTAKCNDIVNLERLEMLGDSFLKFIGTLYIYMKYPKYNEGQATTLKGRLVSNKNLYFLGCDKKVNQILKTNDFSPNAEWLPPGYGVPQNLVDHINNGKLSMSNMYYIELSREEQISGKLLEETLDSINNQVVMYQNSGEDEELNPDTALSCFMNVHSVPDKSIADSVEALIGVYFNCYGVEGALKFMEWLGLFPKTENVTSLMRSPIPNPIINPSEKMGELDFLLPSTTVNKLENIIGYKFNNKAFLLQAITHSSYSRNRLTYSYERLEFIGDAVMDFLITTHIYESCGRLDPGELTDLRSALVNNEIFAAYVVKLGLHKYLLHYNQQLLDNMSRFVKKQENKDFAINDDVLILLNDDDIKIAEDVDCPKVLGDLFESIAGAIYLDSGMNLNKVWEVFHKIMWQEIETFSKNIPKNPIRMLLEKVAPSQPKFSDPVECANGNLMIKLKFMLNGQWTSVYAVGDNKKAAKKAASKMALSLLNSTENIHKT